MMNIRQRGTSVLLLSATTLSGEQIPHFRLRLSFFPNSQQLMVASPSAAHESILVTLMRRVDHILDTIPLPESILYCRVLPNDYHQGDTLHAVPDSTIKMFSKNSEGNREPETLWLVESAFTQSNTDVIKKLRAYIDDLPDLQVIGKILLNRRTKYAAPSPNSVLGQKLRSTPLMTKKAWAKGYGDAEKFSSIVVDGYKWFTLASAEIHIWIRQPGESKINIDRLDGDGYAFGVRP